MPDAPTLQIDRAEAADELAAVLTSGISLLSADYHAALMAGGRVFGTCRPAVPYMAAMDDGTEAADVTPVKAGLIAILPIHGPTVQRSSFLTAALGIPTYDAIRAVAASLKADPSVAGVVLHIDSHGGEAAGVLELGADLSALFGKPVYAAIEGSGQSAGFAIASGAQRIFGAPSARMGNVGVLIPHVDRSGALAQAGIKVSYTYRGDHKIDGAETGPLTPAAQAETDKYADQLYSGFVRTVAQNRGLSQRDVRATEARSYMADEAKALGLIDEVGSLSDAVSALRAKLGRSSSSSAPRGTASKPSAPTGAEGNQMQTAAFLAALGLANETDEAKVLASLTTIKAQAAETGTLRAQAEQTKGQLDMAQRALAAMEAEKATLTTDKAALSAQVATLTEEKRTLQAAQEVATWQAALDAEGVKVDAEGTPDDQKIRPLLLAHAQSSRKPTETPQQAVAGLKSHPFYKYGFEPAAPAKPARTEATGKVLAMAGRVGSHAPVAVADDAEKLISIL